MADEIIKSNSKYVKQISRAGWGRGVADPSFAATPILIGDILYEAGDGDVLLRLFNACVKHSDVINKDLNTPLLRCYKPLSISQPDVNSDKICGPVWSSIGHANRGNFEIKGPTIPHSPLDLDFSITVAKSKKRGALLAFSPLEASRTRLKTCHKFQEWILKNLAWIEEYALECDLDLTGRDGLRFVIGVIDVKKWVCAVWDQMKEEKTISLHLDAQVVSVGGSFQSSCASGTGINIRRGPEPNTNNTTSPPATDYPLKNKFECPQSIFYDAFKLERRTGFYKTLHRKHPSNRQIKKRKKTAWDENDGLTWMYIYPDQENDVKSFQSDSDPDPDPEREGKGGENSPVAPSEGSPNASKGARTGEADNSTSGKGIGSHSPSDKLEMHKVIARYIFAMSPVDVTHVMLRPFDESVITHLSREDGYHGAVGAWLITYAPEIVVEEGVDVKVATFSKVAFWNFYLKEDASEEEEASDSEDDEPEHDVSFTSFISTTSVYTSDETTMTSFETEAISPPSTVCEEDLGHE